MLTTGWARRTCAPKQKELAQQELQVYQQLRAEHLAEVDKQRADIRQFVYSAKDGPSAK